MPMEDEKTVSQPQATPACAGAERDIQARRRVSSEELLAGSRELLIAHEGEEYRLRLTSKSKLILTK